MKIPLQTALEDNTADSAPELVVAEADGALRCLACGHRCLIRPGRAGVCRVRFNADGRLRVPWGYVSGLQVDPIEKKPFYHAFPDATRSRSACWVAIFTAGIARTGSPVNRCAIRWPGAG
jgi:hypothetical protein